METKEWSTSFISAALLGASLLALIEGLLNKEALNCPLTVALYAFSASIPLLAFAVLRPGYRSYLHKGSTMNRTSSSTNRFDLALELLGWVGAIAGLIAVIWHLSQTAAWVFIGTGLFALASRLTYGLLLVYKEGRS